MLATWSVKSLMICFIAQLTLLSTSVRLAAALRPSDAFEEEAAAAAHLMPESKPSMAEESRVGTMDPRPPQGDCARCKAMAAQIRDMVDRIWEKAFWDQKQQDSMILKDFGEHENIEHVDVVRVAEKLLEVSTAVTRIYDKLNEIATLPGSDWENYQKADAILREIMTILTPTGVPDYETKAGTFPAAFVNLGDAMRLAIEQFKRGHMHFNSKFDYQQQALKSSMRTMTGTSHDHVLSEETDDEVQDIPTSSAHDIQDWVHKISERVFEEHGFFFAEPIRSDTTGLLWTGPWYKLIGYCSLKKLKESTSDQWITDPIERGLGPWMLDLDRPTHPGSIINVIQDAWKAKRIPIYDDSESVPLIGGVSEKNIKGYKVMEKVDWVGSVDD